MFLRLLDPDLSILKKNSQKKTLIPNVLRLLFLSERNGSADPDPDPDPHQNVMDPQHCLTVYDSVNISHLFNRTQKGAPVKKEFKVSRIHKYFSRIRIRGSVNPN